jgi:two-component system, cell cycle response regulator DivK
MTKRILVVEDQEDLRGMLRTLLTGSGYDATGQIKADPNLKSTPIIAVSSFAMKGDEEKARASGCDHYVTKPYSPVQLLRLIQGYLGD